MTVSRSISDACNMITCSGRNKVQQKGASGTVSHRVPQLYQLLLVSMCCLNFSCASRLPFSAPGALALLGPIRHDHRLDLAQLKWLSSLRDSAYTGTDSNANDVSPIYPSSDRVDFFDNRWNSPALAFNSFHTVDAEKSMKRVKQLEDLVSKLSDNYLPGVVNEGFNPSYFWPELEKGPVNGASTKVEKPNTEYTTYVTSDPLKRAETHYKERLARLT